MRKKLIAVFAVAALALPLCACSSDEQTELTSYTIDASLSADNILTATVTCDYVNNTDVPLSELWFHLYPNAYREGSKYCPVPNDRITEAYPSGRSYSVMKIDSVAVGGKAKEVTVGGEDENVLIVALDGKLEPTDKASVKIEYSVKLPNVKHRLGYTNKSVNLANFYPIACMYRDGAFVADPYYSIGDPFYSECANYSVTLTVPSNYECACTGEVSGKTEAENTVTYKIGANSVRDFAAVLGEYEKMSGLSGSTIVNYYYYSDADPEKALNAAIDSLRIFGDKFGAYPYKEYTVVQTGFLQGGMEYPALSMISDAYSGDSKLDIIVHETAHQWWYGTVGNDEVKYSWLDEAMAEYSTMMFYEYADGYKYTFEGKRADALSAYMLYCETYKNNGRGDTTMTRAINEYANETEYSYMIYVKGALMLDDIRNTIGTDKFMTGLKQYYKDNKYGIAQPQNLIGAMEKASKRQLKPLFESWLNGNVQLYSTH
ncbi:MAG: M1 family metallopeptidase [Clostridiales bacterium]|nr:M1 family metallopeptidase [Clostridiales bacterium]